MAVIVTLQIFSGLPDPVWELDETEIRELRQRLRSAGVATFARPMLLAPGLGYRGLIVYSVAEPSGELSAYAYGGLVETSPFAPARKADIEKWLLATAKGAALRTVALALTYIQKAADRVRLLSENVSLFDVLAPVRYDPSKWNDDACTMRLNNCYNYACDRITNSFATPGLASGNRVSNINCNSVSDSAIGDGLTKRPANDSWKVALAVSPGDDFHFYRQDDDKLWSHKPGSASARRWDNAFRLITDPETADRGEYTVFCGYLYASPATRIGIM